MDRDIIMDSRANVNAGYTNEAIEHFDQFGILSHQMPNAIGMWPNEIECLMWLCLDSDWDNNEADWMEIGSFCGGSAVAMGCASIRGVLPRPHKIYSVDLDHNPMFDMNIRRAGMENMSEKIVCNSNDLDKHYNGDPLSFVFIDGFHSYRQVIDDFEMVRTWLTDDAIIAFHDVSPNIYSKTYITPDDHTQLYEDTSENFCLDEAILYINRYHDYEFIINPMQKDIKHFKETGLTSWVRGKTSPFNSLCAIRRTNVRA